MDPLTATFVGAGATLLGSLNKRTAKTDLEAAKLLDQEDPIRRSLEAFPLDTPVDARLVFINGGQARLIRVLEIGFGAARLELQMIASMPTDCCEIYAVRQVCLKFAIGGFIKQFGLAVRHMPSQMFVRLRECPRRCSRRPCRLAASRLRLNFGVLQEDDLTRTFHVSTIVEVLNSC